MISIVMKTGIIISGITLLFGCASVKVTGQPASQLTLLTISGKALEKNKAAVNNKDENIVPAYKRLLRDADKALQFGPVSVMDKVNMPPSGDKHDYMSIAPYFWPDSSKPGGVPYIRKDGQTNPEVKEYKDKENMPKLCEQVHTLTLAYYFSENEVYAQHAAKLLKGWFLDAETRMNPNLKYGQAIKGVTEGRGEGLIDTRHFLKLFDATALLKPSKYWSAADEQGMKKWFADFLHWMQTSEVGLDEMSAQNNHGVWYDAQRLGMALYIDSIDLAKRIIQSAADRLDKQLDDKGFFPKEMARTISLHYHSFIMNAFFAIGHLSGRAGVDFWKLTTPSGKSLQQAFNTLKPFLADEQSWEGQQIKPYEFDDGYDILMAGAAQYRCRDCEQAVERLGGDKFKQLKIRLLY
jgi:hypothetical protein